MGPDGPARDTDLRTGVRLAALVTGTPVPTERLPPHLLAASPEMSREERLDAVRELAEQLRLGRDPSDAERALPPHALALLAATVPRRYGTRWADLAPAPRSGARPRGLRDFLWALAAERAR